MADDPEVTDDTNVNVNDDDTKDQQNDDNKQEQQNDDKPEEDDLNLPDDLTQTTPQQQRILMKKLGIKVQKVGELWYPIDKKWYDSWERYTMFDKGDDDIPGGLENLDKSGRPRPGHIDNSDLQDATDPNALKRDIQENRTHIWIHSEVWDLLYAWYTGGPAFPRKVYERGGSYSKEKYVCIYPQLVKLVYCDDKTGDIDCDKFTVKGFPPDYTLKQMAKDLEDEMESKDDDKKEDTPFVHIWLKFGQVKAIYPIDKPKAKVTEEELEVEDKERWVEVPDDYLKTKLDDIALNQQDQTQKKEDTADDTTDTTTENTDNADNTDNTDNADNDNKKPDKDKEEENKEPEKKDFLIVVEKKQDDDSWPRAKGDDWRSKLETGDIIDVKDEQDKWYESLVRFVYPKDSENAGKCIVHYIGWNIKWDEPLECSNEDRLSQRHSNAKGPHRPRKKSGGGYGGGGYYDNSFSFWQNENGAPDQRGVVGLRNLGNTCFMNSTIQCLAQSPQLTEYFLKNNYMHHVNKNNPLGWGGRVAKAWAVLLHDMFSGKYKVVAPRQFKSAIGEVAPRFMGYAQQDSQELLSFVLDGLHEDLNQIENKPTTDAVESQGRSDKAVADESWKTYLKRNQSVVVDLLQGQYKSKVVCPDCGRISITFDPYMFLSVPLPTEKYKVIEYTWIHSDTSKPPTIYGQKMLKVADIDMLKTSVAKAHGVTKDELFVCDIWKSKIHRELRRHDSVGDINRKSDDIFIYHSKRPDPNEWKQKEPEKNEDDKDKVDDNDDDKPPAVAGGDGDAVAGDPNADNDNDNDNNNDDDDERRGGDGDNDIGGAGNGGNYYGNNNNKKKGKSDFQTFVVNNQHRVVARQQYMHGGQQRYEDEPLGYPLLVTLPMKIKVTYNQIRAKLWQLIQPFLHDENLKIEDDDLPFELWAAWGFNNHAKIQNSEDLFDLNQRNLKFLIHWKDPKQYKSSLYDAQQRPRDDSAPAPLDPNSVSSIGYDDDNERRGRGKPIDLSECIHAFCEKETLSENDAWYCSKCKDFKCASKKIDLWGSPDLFIIHLKRFSYTRNWRDRINTLVKFPIEGLDLSPFLLSEEHKKDAIYDLYAVSNHMGGMGGGHYTAYAKNLENKEWYHLDDSRTSKVSNKESIVGSAAYVLYYYKRNPRKTKQRASRVVVDDLVKANQTPQ